MKKDYDKDGTSDWREVVEVFKMYGWQWGGDWKSFKDFPHFQKTFGYKTPQLKKLYIDKKVDKNNYVLI
jgi:peptidoglycan L-alanyl-D-glutamate endopeptidase CwlK